jgi:hypothetical protein
MLMLTIKKIASHANAQESRTAVTFPVAILDAAGEVVDTKNASFRLPAGKVAYTSGAEVIAALRLYGRLPFPVSLPKLTDGSLSIKIRTVYNGADLASMLITDYGVTDPAAVPVVADDNHKPAGKGRKSKDASLPAGPVVPVGDSVAAS